MGKLVIVDECLVPRRYVWIYYKGEDPIGFLKNFRETLRFQFDVSSTRCWERKLLWDYTGDPIRFYNEWKTKKELSRFSTMWTDLRALGFVSKGKKDGDFSLEIYGEVKHEFEPSNWFTKYIWVLYNYLFYNKIREMQIKLCRDYLEKFMNWCKENYGMKTVTTPEAVIEELKEDELMEGLMRRTGMAPGTKRESEPEKEPETAESSPEVKQKAGEESAEPGAEEPKEEK
ncbi:MAG: hypothetical protein JSV63_00780 [Candidatus Aenigmatarchaeota archaeon]|nr:MAG: hypothetical protein JSV63_00780 [Candidatus Aenigmarchaeota archaeon]